MLSPDSSSVYARKSPILIMLLLMIFNAVKTTSTCNIVCCVTVTPARCMVLPIPIPGGGMLEGSVQPYDVWMPERCSLGRPERFSRRRVNVMGPPQRGTARCRDGGEAT